MKVSFNTEINAYEQPQEQFTLQPNKLSKPNTNNNTRPSFS